MKIINEILIFEKEHDYNKSDVIWENNETVRLYNLGIIHHNNNHTFPQFYKYSEPQDTHFCGEYFPINKDEAIVKIKNYTSRLYAEAKAIDELITKL